MTLLIVALLALTLGWTWGHSTARIRIIPIGATADDDALALALADACCETWWTSGGKAHEDGCAQARWTA